MSPRQNSSSSVTEPAGARRDRNEIAAYRIAALLIGVGTIHFVAPKPFDDIIPAELPGNPRLYTYVSGVAELVIGALLLPRRTRRLAALAAAGLFVAVFPGNSTWSGCGGTSPGRCGSSRWRGCHCSFR